MLFSVERQSAFIWPISEIQVIEASYHVFILEWGNVFDYVWFKDLTM